MTTTAAGPRCYRHDNPDGVHGFPAPAGYPPHTWTTSGGTGGCQRCPTPVAQGDLYLCDDGGIIHATCRAT